MFTKAITDQQYTLQDNNSSGVMYELVILINIYEQPTSKGDATRPV